MPALTIADNAPRAGAELEKRMRIPKTTLAALTVPLFALLASGCTPLDKFAPPCPELSLVKDAADLTRFNGRGEDIADLDLDARLVAVPASCRQGTRTTVLAQLIVNAQVVRGPARKDRRAAIAYFVAITDAAGKLLDKQDYRLGVEFPPNTDRVNVASEPVDLSFPVNDKVHAPDYKIYIGFSLTPEELAYNRRRNATP
jgi:hypothetical protein